jgi:hypothetical protein
MSYFRIKKVKGKDYAYIVESRWSKKGPRQKVGKYLGRVYSFDKKEGKTFEEFVSKSIKEYVQSKDTEGIVEDLIKWELYRHEVNKGFFIDIKNHKIMKGKRDVVLKINEGMLCGESIKRILTFKRDGNEQDGYRLAKAFVEAGIEIPKEVFVAVFSKVKS